MSTYAEATLPEMSPGNATDAAGARALFAEARRTATLAKGMFGPIAIHHSDVTELLRDKRLRGPGMDLARLSGIPEGGAAPGWVGHPGLRRAAHQMDVGNTATS